MSAETIGYFETDNGRVSVAADIVERVIVDELKRSENFRVGGPKSEGGFFGRREPGLQLEFNAGRVVATIPVHVRFNTKIRREARDLQGKLVRAVSARTGLEVDRIAVDVYQVFEVDTLAPALPAPEPSPPEAANLEPAEV